jgi:hypothetical protein
VPSIPQWAIGKHITSVLFVPQTVSTTDGSLSDTTPTRQFFGHLENIEEDVSFEMENISAMDRPYKNMVPIEQGATVRLTEFESPISNSSLNNLAAAAAFGATYFKYTLVRGVNSFVGYGVLESYKMSASKASVKAQFALAPIDVGTASIVYS